MRTYVLYLRCASPISKLWNYPLMINSIPEIYPYPDDGCEVSSSCLECPLPKCKHDDPIWYQQEQKKLRDIKVMQVQIDEGLNVAQLAQRFSLSKRTIFRILSGLNRPNATIHK